MEALKALWYQITHNPWTPHDTLMTIVSLTGLLIWVVIVMLIDYRRNKQLKNNI